jgi:hypothetical protein
MRRIPARCQRPRLQSTLHHCRCRLTSRIESNTAADLLPWRCFPYSTAVRDLDQSLAAYRIRNQYLPAITRITRYATILPALLQARLTEATGLRLTHDIKTLVVWLERDILALAGPTFEDRGQLFNFIVAELKQRESLDSVRIRPVCRALKCQRDPLLRFAQVLDAQLVNIAQQFQVPDYLVRAICLLQRKPETSLAYWQRRYFSRKLK